jgi:hypothetical protein
VTHVFDKLKKPEDDKNTDKQKTGQACVTLQNNIGEENLIMELKLQEQEPSDETNALTELEKLEEEWQQLSEEKMQLEKTEKTLKKKVLEEIKVKRHNIEILKKQIPILKERCEKLAKMLDIQIQK